MRLIVNFLVVLSAISSNVYAEKLKVVASFSVLGDFARQVGGDTVDVDIIVPENSDPHVYQPTPDDVKKVAKADIILINGLGFEGWFERLLNNSGGKAKVVTVTSKVKPRTILDSKQGTSVYDPHAWHSVTNAILYVDEVEKAFSSLRPTSKKIFKKNATLYRVELTKLHDWIVDKYKSLKIPHHMVVTTHDAFWYYGETYGITFLSPVGISTEAEPSAAAVAQLIETVREKDIRAVFIENLSNRKLIEQIAQETKTMVDGTLYADSLSDPKQPDSPAKTYIEMIRHNTNEIVKGLQS